MYKYNPDFFIPNDIDDAKKIILTNESIGTETRWEKETEWTINFLDNFCEIDQSSVFLDWGCGIGRLSKAIIERYNCNVLGVDLQPKMLEYAQEYVNNDKFATIAYQAAFSSLPMDFFTHSLAVWVFQHSPYIQYEIPLVYRALKNKGCLFVLENISKAIPNHPGGAQPFYDDGIGTKSILEQLFALEGYGQLPLKYSNENMHKNSWWALLSKSN